MPPIDQHRRSTPFSDDNLQQEYEAVYRQLVDGLTDLRPPLGDLVLGQLGESFQPPRVGLLLAASLPAQDTLRKREQRILLAAALEMLHLALQIHKLLFHHSGGANAQNMDRSWVGSIILAGDYCFSRSAILTAHTDEPQVVEIFARALQVVSEAHLRRLFHAPTHGVPGEFTGDLEHEQREQNTDQLEANVLIDAGLKAASRLAGLSNPMHVHVDEQGRFILPHLNQLDVAPPIFQDERWAALLSLIARHPDS